MSERDERDEREGHSPVNVVVVGWRDGRIVERVLCESEEEAAAVAEHWADLDFTRIEIEDLSSQHGPDDILEPGIEIRPGEEIRTGEGDESSQRT